MEVRDNGEVKAPFARPESWNSMMARKQIGRRWLECGLLLACVAVWGAARPALALDHDHGDHDHGDHEDHGKHGHGDEGAGRGDDHHHWDEREAGHDGPGEQGRGHAYGHYKHADYRFRDEDRGYFRDYYADAARYRSLRDRQRYYEGERLEGEWRQHFRPVPVIVVRQLPPPPPGYVFGYSDGYAVAYNPTTRVIADVIDLAGALSHH
jgi:Ni/Co efflux regulator RcnB